MGELIGFNAEKENPLKNPKDLVEMCFRATFVTSFLVDGAGFPYEYVVEAVNVINGQKVGWALGSMLYEVRSSLQTWNLILCGSLSCHVSDFCPRIQSQINTLPWEFTESSVQKLAPPEPTQERSSMLLGDIDQFGRVGDFRIGFASGLILLGTLVLGLLVKFQRKAPSPALVETKQRYGAIGTL